MIDYDLADYVAAVMGNFLSAITIYFSIITAYVVAAFVAGDRLTKLQLVIVNITFTIAAGVMGTLTWLLFDRFFELARQLQSQGGGPGEVELVDFGIPLAILVAIIYLGGLVFMWTVRRRKSDAPFK